jgi:hypothetical protein
LSFDGAGNYNRTHNWTSDASNGINISASEMDQEDNSIAGAFNNCVTRDGQGVVSANFLPNADNTLSLGTSLKRWANINGIPFAQIATTLNQAPTGFFYAQSGAKVQRFNDRVFVGDATANDGIGPTPTTPDWLTTWQLSVGIPFGAVASAQFASLATAAAAAVTTPIGGLFAARGFSTNQSGQNVVGLETYAINNSPSFANSAWGLYTEAHRFNNVVGATIGYEVDVTQRGAFVGITPYSQPFGMTVGQQVASGAQQGALATASFATNVMTISLINNAAANGLIQVGWRVSGVGIPANTTISSFGTGAGGTGTYNLSTTPGTVTSRLVAVSPMFDNTAAYNIQANPNSFATAINVGANAITGTDGVNGIPSPAFQLGRFHGLFWFASSTIGTASIYSDATASIGSPQVQLGQAAVNFLEQSSAGKNFQVALTTNAVNFPFAQGATTGNAATIGAVGGDTNVDLGVFCQGTGVVKFLGASMITANGAVATTMTSLGPAGSHTTVQEWLTIKNAAGTVRYIPCY